MKRCFAALIGGLMWLSLGHSGIGVAATAEPPVKDRVPARQDELARRAQEAGATLSDGELQELLRLSPATEVDVSLVMVPALVVNRRGRSISGLSAADFRLEENGRYRPLAWFSEDADRPLRLALLVDVSGSMEEQAQLARVQDALLPLVADPRHRDRFLLLTFSDGQVEQQTDWTNNAPLVVGRALDAARGGETAIADALALAAPLLPAPSEDRPAIVLITDGVDNASQQGPQDVIDAARTVGAPIYVLAVGGIDRQLEDKELQEKQTGSSPLDPLRRIAQETGGRFFFVSDLDDAQRAAQTVRDDMRHQYWLAFRPDRPLDGSFRPIKVSVNRAGIVVRTRSGYR